MPNARQDLEAYRNSKDAVLAAKYILERSNKPNILFHAVSALKGGILKYWHALPRSITSALRRFLIQYLIQKVE
jgi:hypothetical protein